MSATFLNPINTQTWVNGRHVVRCVKVIRECWDVSTYCFMSESPVMYFFKPGQFVTLELEINGEQVMRSYTISSSPSVPYSFSISVKRDPAGLCSNWLHENLAEGEKVVVHGPVGDFNCIDYPSDKVLMLSAGVGITPVMSMARWWFDTNGEVDMIFVHSARTPKEIIYRRELEYMDSRIANFNLSIVCKYHDIGETWNGYKGHLTEDMLRMIAPDFMEREVFCCGPTPYMDAVKGILERNGFPLAHYHDESFGSTPVEVMDEVVELAEEAAHESEIAVDIEKFQVRFNNTGKCAEVSPGETVHEAAAKLGLHIPKACGMGICGTCKVLVTDGDVVMEHNGGITPGDIKAGYILSCCSVPQGHVAVEY
jgi:glycine betaine monooxygenase B